MSRSICGNCANFKPEKGQRFFNCTYATHAGTSYGMQVRADTASCDAFKLIQRERAQASLKQTPSKQARTRVVPPGLCPWGRLLVITAIMLILILLAWATYALALKSTNTSDSPPRPTLAPTVTGSSTTAPTPAPSYLIIGNYTVGQWAVIPGELASIVSAARTYVIAGEIGGTYAPPGLVYIRISASASNTLDRNMPFHATHFFLKDSAGNEWQSARDSTGYKFAGVISPGSSDNASLWFLVPDIPYPGLKVYWALMGDPMKWTVWNLTL